MAATMTPVVTATTQR